eukprot:gene5529-6888_t
MINKREKKNKSSNNENESEDQQSTVTTTTTNNTKPVTVNLYDSAALKQTLDDSAVKYVTDVAGFTQDQTVNYYKVGFGLIGCILAAVAQFYPRLTRHIIDDVTDLLTMILLL